MQPLLGDISNAINATAFTKFTERRPQHITQFQQFWFDILYAIHHSFHGLFFVFLFSGWLEQLFVIRSSDFQIDWQTKWNESPF